MNARASALSLTSVPIHATILGMSGFIFGQKVTGSHVLVDVRAVEDDERGELGSVGHVPLSMSAWAWWMIGIAIVFLLTAAKIPVKMTSRANIAATDCQLFQLIQAVGWLTERPGDAQVVDQW